MTRTLTIARPDDWHLHLRSGTILRAVLPFTARDFARAIVMPNLDPPVVSHALAERYRQEILAALPEGMSFEPLMTLYLTDTTDAQDLAAGHAAGTVTAAKLYPAGATTNSASGVTAIRHLHGVLETMQRIDMPLLVHGEVVDPDVDVYDREAVFIERVLAPLRRDFPALRIVLEHVTSAEGVDFVMAQPERTAATVTPHHLVINRSDMFAGGIRPHLYCLPIAKRERHRQALRRAATSGDARFFLGTDSAPHTRAAKQSACGCAGIFNAPTALAYYAQVFDDAQALDRLEGFCSLHGPAFYGLPVNAGRITLIEDENAAPPGPVEARPGPIEVFAPPALTRWRVRRQ